MDAGQGAGPEAGQGISDDSGAPLPVAMQDAAKKRAHMIAEIEKRLKQVSGCASTICDMATQLDVVVGAMFQKNEHVETLAKYTHNDRIRQRFHERMDAVEVLWGGIKETCENYVRSAESNAVPAFESLILHDPQHNPQG